MAKKTNRICPNCGFNSPSIVECAKCGIYFEKYKLIASKSSVDSLADELALRGKDQNQYLVDSRINAWALPVAVVISWIVHSVWTLRMLGHFTSSIPLHELGHAVMAWIGGIPAIPVGFFIPTAGQTLSFENRNFLVSLPFWGILSFIGYRAWLEKLWFVGTLSILTIFISIYFTAIEPLSGLKTWMVFSGCAGEFILGATLILAFHNPLFSLLRWDFFRYPFLLMGTYSYLNAFLMWNRIQRKIEAIPYGTGISVDGAKDINGDMNRLIASGWTEADITSRYVTVGKICLSVIVIQYVYSLVKSRFVGKP